MARNTYELNRQTRSASVEPRRLRIKLKAIQNKLELAENTYGEKRDEGGLFEKITSVFAPKMDCDIALIRAIGEIQSFAEKNKDAYPKSTSKLESLLEPLKQQVRSARNGDESNQEIFVRVMRGARLAVKDAEAILNHELVTLRRTAA